MLTCVVVPEEWKAWSCWIQTVWQDTFWCGLISVIGVLCAAEVKEFTVKDTW